MMSRISSREKKLIGSIFALLFVFGNVIALRWWTQELEDVEKEQHQLDLALIEDEILYEERLQWMERQTWMDATIQVFPGRESADARLLKLVSTSASEVGVMIDSLELLEPPNQEEGGLSFARAGVRVRASGDFSQLTKWLHSFQEPNDFRSFKQFELKNDDKEPGLVHCRFQCWQWQRKPSSEAMEKVVNNK